MTDHTTLGDALIESLRQARAHARGERTDLGETHVDVTPDSETGGEASARPTRYRSHRRRDPS